jgi:hypothetical protein
LAAVAAAAMIAGAALPAAAAVQKTVMTFEQFTKLTGVSLFRVKNGKIQYAQFKNRPTIANNGFTVYLMKTGKIVFRVNTQFLKKPTAVASQFYLPGQNKPINISFNAAPPSTPGGSSGIDLGGFPKDPPPVSPS